METAEVNQFGNEVIRSFEGDIDRYKFDFGLCTHSKGWIQFDTDEDAWYFGVWVHKEQKKIVTYAEENQKLWAEHTKAWLDDGFISPPGWL